METITRIGEKLRTLRAARHLNQEEVAEAIGISTAKLSRWEHDEAFPDVEELRKAAAFYKVSSEWLLSPEPVVFNVQNNSGGNNGGWHHIEQHFPEEFVQRLMDRYDTRHEAHVKELQQANARYEQMNARLLELLEKKLG